MVEVAEELVEAVIGRQHVVEIAEMVLAELPGRIALVLERAAIVMIFSVMPIGAAGMPTLDSPVRSTLCPVMKDDRPAVQDCSP